MVRLKTNLIVDGKFFKFGSIIDPSLVPPHLRDHDHVQDLESNEEGAVLVLRDLNFQTLPRPDSDGVPVSYPVRVVAGQLLDLNTVPPAKRQLLKDGEDYRSNWTLEEQEAVLKAASEVYFNDLEAEPVIVPIYTYRGK
jgi:hypothetical protein